MADIRALKNNITAPVWLLLSAVALPLAVRLFAGACTRKTGGAASAKRELDLSLEHFGKQGFGF